jgi:phosphoglycolate phosphatase-like HAD superfamily hydrolase
MKDGSGIQWSGRTVKAVVFDVDGTLTDSIEAYYIVFRDACARFGIRVQREDVLDPMAVGGNIWERVFPLDLPGREEMLSEFRRVIPGVFSDVIRQVKPFPGLKPVLSGLRDKGIRLGILTSSWKLALLPLSENNLIQYFEAIITREDSFALKPSPEGMLECLSRIGISPDCALMVGDSPLDIRAGRTAGVLTIAVLSGIASRGQLEAEAPTAIIDDVSQLTGLLSGNQA